MRNRACGCLLALLLLLALLVCLSGYALSEIFAPRAHAKGNQAVVELAPQIPAAPFANGARGIFFTRQVEIEYYGGAVWLAATRDGSQHLASDDFAELRITRADGTVARWTHDFRNAARTAIVPLPPQEISRLFRRGRNEVEISLHDLTPFTYWSAPYCLIFDAPTPVPPTIPPPSPTITARASATPLVMTATRLPTPTATLAMGAILNADGGASSGQPAQFDARILAAGAFGALVFFLVLFLVRRHAARAEDLPTLRGWLDVYDRVTREGVMNLDLTLYQRGAAISIEPLRIQAFAESQEWLAAVVPTREGARLVLRDAGLENAHDDLVRDGARREVASRIEIEYRNPLAQEWQGGVSDVTAGLVRS